MRRIAIMLAIGTILGGCATRPMTLDCPDFRTRYSAEVPPSQAVREIQSDNDRPDIAGEPISREQRMNALIALLENNDGIQNNRNPADAASAPTLLALSGGGQWGAFGAGYLKALDEKKETRLPQFTTITGVSTGALQALFVGASQATGAPRDTIMANLAGRYTIDSERDIVKRRGYLGALAKGSVAGLGPLRSRIENALCTTANDTLTCPIIDHLAAEGAPTVLLGFVEASSGQMQMVSVTKIAKDAVAKGNQTALKSAQQCITAGALASVAMPFYYQQVQIRSEPAPGQPMQTLTYYDGGVRQSVFLDTIVEALETARARNAVSAPMTIYVLRNGPTVARPDPGIDAPSGAVKTAERGYSLIVNQSEVAAIESIRLRHPNSDMRVATADGYNKNFTDPAEPKMTKVCEKKVDGAMFEPGFMKCLQAFGRHKAARDEGGWITLSKPEPGK